MQRLSTSFHILSFEGPDAYARAGGIASRICGLADALAHLGAPTHLWFVGDPERPGHEQSPNAGPMLHRWCQWISAYHPGGVYEGESGKVDDYAQSLPPYLVAHCLRDELSHPDHRAVILAEEWQTVPAVLHLDHLLRRAGLRDRVTILWNANNVFGFDRIDFPALAACATITTVSRYMRQLLLGYGVEAVAIPNGLASHAFDTPPTHLTTDLRGRLRDRLALTKIARWDPDKRWLLAVDSVADLAAAGRRPLLIARGGLEAHGREVVERATAKGLRLIERTPRNGEPAAVVEALADLDHADVVHLNGLLSPASCRLLFRAARAVVVNSSHEPFGLVGLEAMAAGGLACVGSTGEDYAKPGWNALALQTSDPGELGRQLARLDHNPEVERGMRRRAASAAREYVWTEVLQRHLLPHVGLPPADQMRLRPAHRIMSVTPQWRAEGAAAAVPMAAAARA